MANGDRTEDAWLELLPIHLDDTASFWYDRQTTTTKLTWTTLFVTLITKFQERESYQNLLETLSLVRQNPEETVRQFSERVRELLARIQRSLSCLGIVNGEVCPSTPDHIAANLSSIDALALRSFVGGLKPAIQEIVAWKDPSTFEAALTLVQHKELNLSNIAQLPLTVVTVSPMVMKIIQVSPYQNEVKSETVSKDLGISQLVAEMRDLKLFLLQGQSNN